LVFADALKEHTVTSQLEIDLRLMPPPNGKTIDKMALRRLQQHTTL